MPKTVLILGAGASIPYGFPSGEDLVKAIIGEIHITSFLRNEPNPSKDQVLANLLLKKFSFKHIESFRNALIKSGTYSIDSFLTNREEFRKIGKMCIAYIIMNCEKRSLSSNFIFDKGDWYKYFWNKINIYRESENFDFKIYTFNYDRSLEYYLYTAFKNLHNPNQDHFENFFKRIPIIHLHGSLGDLGYSEKADFFYGNIDIFKNHNKLYEVCDSINVIYEANNENFIQLQDDIGFAENIIFLGFGFHPDNMKRIKINRGEEFMKMKIYATTFKMTEYETIQAFENFLGKFEKNIGVSGIIFEKCNLNTFSAFDCLSFFREKIHFNIFLKQ